MIRRILVCASEGLETLGAVARAHSPSDATAFVRKSGRYRDFRAAALVAGLAALSLSACGGETRIDCADVPAIDDELSAASYPVVGQPTRREAEAIAAAYLAHAFCTRTLPSRSRFAARGFTAAELTARYRVIGFAVGFGKQPAGLRIRFRDGPELLFCFHRLVTACAPGRPCRCPYDDDAVRDQPQASD